MPEPDWNKLTKKEKETIKEILQIAEDLLPEWGFEEEQEKLALSAMKKLGMDV